jgi:hypothetical protein
MTAVHDVQRQRVRSSYWCGRCHHTKFSCLRYLALRICAPLNLLDWSAGSVRYQSASVFLHQSYNLQKSSDRAEYNSLVERLLKFPPVKTCFMGNLKNQKHNFDCVQVHTFNSKKCLLVQRPSILMSWPCFMTEFISFMIPQKSLLTYTYAVVQETPSMGPFITMILHQP